MEEPTQKDGELTPEGMEASLEKEPAGDDAEELAKQEADAAKVEQEALDAAEKAKELPEPTIKELVERLDKSEKRVGYLTRKLRPGQPLEKPKEPGTKPLEADFETYPEYVEALTDFKVDERDAKRTEARIKEHAARQQDDFFAVIDSGVDKYPDFNEVARKNPADGGPTINGSMLEAMSECDNIIDIAYHLGQNVAESQRISRLSPIAAAREIGKLEARFSGDGPQKIPQKTPKTITPSKPVSGKTVTDSKLEDLSTDDFMKSRNQAAGVL